MTSVLSLRTGRNSRFLANDVFIENYVCRFSKAVMTPWSLGAVESRLLTQSMNIGVARIGPFSHDRLPLSPSGPRGV